MNMHVGFAPNVVTRLRIAFAAIAFIVVSVSIIGARQLANVNDSIRNLTVSSIEVFVRVEFVERNLKNLIVTLQQINRAQTPDELTQLGGELGETLADLRSKISELGRIQQTGTMSDEMSRTLQQIDFVSILILEKNRDVMGHQATLDLLEADLFGARDIIRGLLEDELFGIELIVLNDTAVTGAPSAPDVSDLAQSYSRQLLRANAISTITLELDAIVDRVGRLRNTQDFGEIQDTEDEIRLKLRSITGLLPQIETGDARASLAQSIRTVRNLIVGTTSIVSEVKVIADLQLELDAFILTELAETEKISLLSRRLIADARSIIDNANVEVTADTSQMIWILSVAAVTVLVVIVVTMIVVIERQINARMFRLTHAVLAIAGGAKGVEVGVHGTDEFGKMAQSLEVFKSNAEELVRSNKELEKFAYIAAHDLRSPLRAIQDLAAWIAEDEDNKLSTNSIEMMALLNVRVERLNRLLADLLSYSRLGSEAEALATVSIAEIVDELSDMLDPERKFEIRFDGNINTITTLATPLRQILQNLLNNSIKHHDRDAGLIRVSTALLGGRLHCRIEDDGPGIAKQYQVKIFQLFQTLRPRDEVEGSGIGLAIVQKLVESYGGTISIDSDPDSGRGSVFGFDIPVDTHKSLPANLAA